MQYTTQVDPETGICSVSVSGEVRRPQDSVELQRFARDFGFENDCHAFVFDLRRATIIGGTLGAFETGTVPADTNRRQREQAIALVYSGDLRDHKFLETVAVNRGYNVRVFDDVAEAREWLARSLPETPA